MAPLPGPLLPSRLASLVSPVNLLLTRTITLSPMAPGASTTAPTLAVTAAGATGRTTEATGVEETVVEVVVVEEMAVEGMEVEGGFEVEEMVVEEEEELEEETSRRPSEASYRIRFKLLSFPR